ncbi:hypothetical protein A5893_14345 [Pedobacter psychrophilus]|uniref:Glycosyl transferase family 1 domain-containing protein n=1 Tax=Pedobacter psychrophilus TaxID=1826909 RepID=A0A179DD12_9SPHI|nr:glycosyltransferase [Pedobacter psychrophilus]OAQ38590.1 hypothetical protein A5893_14345 [Pedobacter psychrophilus]
MKKIQPKIILIHPGIQYTYRMSSALAKINLISSVSLYTWFTLSYDSFLSKFDVFKKRVKEVDKKVTIHNFLIFELFLTVYLKTLSVLNIDKGNTPRYKMQVLFGWFLLPMVYFKRRNSILVLSETAGWPIAYYAKKWNIPVVMDFPSISHEAALKGEIKETSFGIKIKSKERQYIDFGTNCSRFAAETYKGLTSAKKHFPIWLAADKKILKEIKVIDLVEELNICCLANTEKRKGIDILLTAFQQIDFPKKKLFLIGKIDKNWVQDFCDKNDINNSNIILTGPLAQQDLSGYLLKNNINLHILPSRFDSFGMVVPETMMLGIPNILSPKVGAGEMLKNGKNGYIMKNLDSLSLVNAIENYLGLSYAEKNILRENVIQQASEMTWENYDKRIAITFDEILMDINL